MKVQTKILLLLLGIVLTFISGLVALKITEDGKFKAIAERRANERNRIFDEFLDERGDRLKVVVQDSTNWDDLVKAIVKNDQPWTEAHFGDGVLATYQINAGTSSKESMALACPVRQLSFPMISSGTRLPMRKNTFMLWRGHNKSLDASRGSVFRMKLL
jgi:hypothetical protein